MFGVNYNGITISTEHQIPTKINVHMITMIYVLKGEE
jgi:hypothetical protein